MSESQNQPDQEQLDRIAEQNAARAAARQREHEQARAQNHMNPNEISVSVLGTNLLSNVVYELYREEKNPDQNPHTEWFEGYENGTALPPRLDDVFNGQGSFGLNYGGTGHMAWLSKNFHAKALGITSMAIYNFIMKTVCPTPRTQHGFMNMILFYVKLARAIIKANPQQTEGDAEDDDTYISRIVGLVQPKVLEKKATTPVAAPAKAVKAAPVAQKAKAKVVEEEEEEDIEEADDAEEDDLDEEDDEDDDLDELEEEEDDGWATKSKSKAARPVAKPVARPVAKTAKKPVYSRKH
jgi:hypothetical protein